MLIEGAFTKIPEILIGYDDKHYLYEAGITNLFSNAILLELNARNIDNPLSKILFEKRYQDDINERCDIYTNFDFINQNLTKYGYHPTNWIEAKYFGNIAKKRGSETKSANAGSIAYDMYRLIKNTDGEDGLYSLVIFDDKPEKYLAMTRQSKTKPKRIWVDSILKDGIQDFEFSLKDEPETIKKLFGIEKLDLECSIRVLTFSPLDNGTGYYGSLIQILKTIKLESPNVTIKRDSPEKE